VDFDPQSFAVGVIAGVAATGLFVGFAALLVVGILEFEPLTQVPEHLHDKEQMGLVLKGSITMVIDGERRDLQAGGMYPIRSGIPHSGEAGPDGATVLDVFSPVRSDWYDTPRLDVAKGRWP